MYSIGDKIVYPMHGAGVIESIEKREILGSKQDYYVLGNCSNINYLCCYNMQKTDKTGT